MDLAKDIEEQKAALAAQAAQAEEAAAAAPAPEEAKPDAPKVRPRPLLSPWFEGPPFEAQGKAVTIHPKPSKCSSDDHGHGFC